MVSDTGAAECYICDMDYTEFLLWKAGILIGVVFVVNFVYTFITGESIEQARTGTQPAQEDREGN